MIFGVQGLGFRGWGSGVGVGDQYAILKMHQAKLTSMNILIDTLPADGNSTHLRYKSSTQECRAEWPTGEIGIYAYFEMFIS